MSKDVNRDPVKLRSSNRNDSQDSISKKNNVSTLKDRKNSSGSEQTTYIDENHKRLNKLKRAIGSGHFRIDSTRVAEKFIQFESQFSIQ